MELIERAEFIELLETRLSKVTAGEGHCVFVSGEAGIGKTSLVKTFCKDLKREYKLYQGTCDALFTPRPLAPLYDILLQAKSDLWKSSTGIEERAALFTNFFHELVNQKEPIIIVFEDIHWADEATLDFIKFLARRITQLPCLFILTYRDNEIHSQHPLRHVLGQLPPDSFTRMHLPHLSRQVVEKMAGEKGYSGEDVYSISGGNPFYVNEILASYSPGIPDNIRDSVLYVFNRQGEKTRRIWELLSVIPTGFEIKYLEKFEPQYADALERCLEAKILIVNDGLIFFKHELYRRTVEASLSPLFRVSLNKKILDLFLENFEKDGDTERIIHHAKNANEYYLVVHYAPLAAKRDACLGAHLEAAKLYLSAIEYYQGNDKDVLLQFYESYAYECYLTNQVKEAIIYTGKALNLWQEKNDTEKTGNTLRFLSRLWWFEGNRKKAELFAEQAIAALDKEASSSAKAMAYSNMSQLKMLSDQTEECIFWGERAIDMAKELGDQEVLCHALNNVGDVRIREAATRQEGMLLLQQSLEIALKNSFHEHAARAYTNMGHNGITIRDHAYAKQAIEAGLRYCEERNLDSWTTYMLSSKAKLYLDAGQWNEACTISDALMKNDQQTAVVKIGALSVLATVKMRCDDSEVLPLLKEAKTKAFETMELQRIIPVLSAFLEYEWITGQQFIEKEALENTIRMMDKMGNTNENSQFAYWLFKARGQQVALKESFEGYPIGNTKEMVQKAAATWEKAGCPYERALALFEGTDEDKRTAITIVQGLGANMVYEKMKMEMRTSGIKSIPRGIRKSTQSNAALLTSRELDVLQLLKEGMQNKEIAGKLFISAKTVDHHISAILFKLDVSSRNKAVQEAIRMEIIK